MDLAQVLGALPENDPPRVLADFRGSSDAGVFLIDDDRALVRNVDFFMPIVHGSLIDILLDPQTSGGLLICVPDEKEEEFRE